MTATHTTTLESAAAAVEAAAAAAEPRLCTGTDLSFQDIGARVTLSQRSIDDDRNVRITTVTGTLTNITLESDPEWYAAFGRKIARVIITLGHARYTLTHDHTALPDWHNSRRDWILADVEAR